jgi:hypothetical protein
VLPSNLNKDAPEAPTILYWINKYQRCFDVGGEQIGRKNAITISTGELC